MTFPEAGERVRFSRPASRDFAELLSFTGRTWGEGQLDLIRHRILDALLIIVKHPGIGRKLSGLGLPYRLYGVGAHNIVYQAQDDVIRVIRILHHRRDLKGQLRG